MQNVRVPPITVARPIHQAIRLEEQFGYRAEEPEPGAVRAWHVPIWGYLAAIVVVAAITWLLRR